MSSIPFLPLTSHPNKNILNWTPGGGQIYWNWSSGGEFKGENTLVGGFQFCWIVPEAGIDGFSFGFLSFKWPVSFKPGYCKSQKTTVFPWVCLASWTSDKMAATCLWALGMGFPGTCHLPALITVRWKICACQGVIIEIQVGYIDDCALGARAFVLRTTLRTELSVLSVNKASTLLWTSLFVISIYNLPFGPIIGYINGYW